MLRLDTLMAAAPPTLLGIVTLMGKPTRTLAELMRGHTDSREYYSWNCHGVNRTCAAQAHGTPRQNGSEVFCVLLLLSTIIDCIPALKVMLTCMPALKVMLITCTTNIILL